MSRRRGRARPVVLVVAGLAALAAAGAATLGLGGRGPEDAAGQRTGPAATVPVTRQTLVDAVTLTGRLSYGAELPLTTSAPGTVTWLPRSGATVRRGGVLLRADEQPVVLLFGAVPMYRTLAVGAEGADVRQMEANLLALGYGGFSVDRTYSPATAAAVRRWQEHLGLPPTGAVERHRVVFAAGPLRVARPLVRPGGPAAGDVLAATGRTRQVVVPASPAEAAWAAPGTRVTVILSSGDSTGGRVASVGRPPADAAAGQRGDEAGDAVEINISVPDQRALGGSPGGDVRVRYVAQERRDVLTVPVTALLALAEGGYGLEVVAGGTSRIVAVRARMFADGRVEVSGPGLAEGVAVGVPE